MPNSYCDISKLHNYDPLPAKQVQKWNKFQGVSVHL